MTVQEFRFELHYFLDDNSHKMNALLKNRAEYDLIRLFYAINDIIGVDGEYEIEALEPGGQRNFFTYKTVKKLYKGLNKNGALVALLTGLILYYIEKNDTAQTNQLEVVEKNIDLYKKIYGDDISLPSAWLPKVIDSINNDHKVQSLKSNFFEKLTLQTKIEKISFGHIDEQKKPLMPFIEIERKDFYKQILSQKDLPAIKEYYVDIEIVSPVLTNKKVSWKGIYKGKSINFRMDDSVFTRKVINKEYSFINGTHITCDMETQRKINDDGEIDITDIIITNVVSINNGTPQNIIRNRNKGTNGNQLTLF